MKINRYILPLALLCSSLLFLYQKISEQQQQNLQNWLRKVERLLVIEVGAGTHIPTVRMMSESVGGRLIRINPDEPGLGRTEGVSLPYGGLAALRAIDAGLQSELNQ